MNMSRKASLTNANTNTALPALAWSDALVTGHAGVDAMHREFVEQANALVMALDTELPERLCAFEAHAIAHFTEEDRLMTGTAYPSAGCHVEEHAAVLASIAEVRGLLAQGDVAVARELADELVRWFPEHTHHMDQSLTAWLTKQATGGQPMVFRRAPASGRPLGSPRSASASASATSS